MRTRKIKHIIQVWKTWNRNGWTDHTATYTRASDGRSVVIDREPLCNIRLAVRELNGGEFGNIYEAESDITASEMQRKRKYGAEPVAYSKKGLAYSIKKALRDQVKQEAAR